MVEILGNELAQVLASAKNLYTATALINDAGFDFIRKNSPPTCSYKFLIGFDLPSSPRVFEELYKLESSQMFTTRIFKEGPYFHPKVYIIEDRLGELICFVGSANTTNGGLFENCELSAKLVDQGACMQIKNWFDSLFNNASELSQTFIESYKRRYHKIKSREAAINSDLRNLLKLNNSKQASNSSPVSSHQFFNDKHFFAYDEQFWLDYSNEANARRKTVKERLKYLHNKIHNRFKDFSLENLHPHPNPSNIVSSEVHKRGFTRDIMDAIWLHYGVGANDITTERKFIDYPRIQIILRRDYIGIWLLVGKNRGGVNERSKLKERFSYEHWFLVLFFEELIKLGGSYYLELNQLKTYVDQIDSPEYLCSIISNDKYDSYFKIGRDYERNDPSLSVDNIEETVLLEFSRLNCVYRLIL